MVVRCQHLFFVLSSVSDICLDLVPCNILENVVFKFLFQGRLSRRSCVHPFKYEATVQQRVSLI